MNTNHLTRNKISNLSVTSRSQKENARRNNNSAKSDSSTSKDNTSLKLSNCSGGVCGINWKPYPRII